MSISTEITHAGRRQLIEQVKDYLGYEDGAQRAQTDAAVRRHLTEQLIGILKLLEQKFQAKEAADQERLEKLQAGVQRKLKTICTSLRNPTYQQGSFFNGRRVSARVLGRIYDLETDMTEETEHIRAEVIGLQDSVNRLDFEDRFMHIQNYIDNFNQSLFEREALIIGDL